MPINSISDEDIEHFKIDGSMATYQKIATQTAIYPGQGSPMGLMYVSLKDCGETGEFAEHVGKAIRDDGYGTTYGSLTRERCEYLIKEIGDELWYLCAKCEELGITLTDAAMVNLIKLSGRAKRGKLQGSGDDR